MKFKFIKVPLFITLLSTVSLTGCLKDGYFNDGTTQAFSGGTIQTVGLNLSATSSDNFSAYPVPNIFTDTVINFVQVELGGPSAASQDISVTVDTSSAILDSLNNVGVGPGDLFDPGTITIVNPVVIIPKGQRTAWLQIKFVPHDYIGQDVGIGFYIKSVSPNITLSGNRANGAVQLIIENYLDGKYFLTEKTTNGAAWSGSADGQTYQWPTKIVYSSTGSNSNSINTQEYGGPLQVAFTPSGGLNGFGGLSPSFTIDPVTHLLTEIDNLAPDSRGRVATINSAVTDSRWDPATGTIYLAYYVTQATPARAPMYVYDTLTYYGPR